MIELVVPSWTEPAKPIRMYYLPVTQGDAVSTPRAQTLERFADGTMDRNIEVDDDIDWKITLSEWDVKSNKWRKDEEAWTKNSARVYHLVLQHCPPDLKAELQNHSKWISGKSYQNYIDLILMIRDIIQNTKETK